MKTLLILDDEQQVREVVRDALSESNVQISEATNAHDAILLCQAVSFDVILSDYDMPKLDGLEFLKILREMNSDAPVIWLTGRGSHELYQNAWENGIFDYIEKPFNPEALQRVIQAALHFGASSSANKSREPLRDLSKMNIPVRLEKKVYDSLLLQCLDRGQSPSTFLKEAALEFLRTQKKRA